MFKRLFNITICLVMIFGSILSFAGANQVSAEGITIFESPGIAAYSEVDPVVYSLENVASSCSDTPVYSSENDFFSCQMHIEGYNEIYDPYLFVHDDGFIMAYYRNGEPTSKMVDIINFDLENTLLAQVISKVVDDINLIVDPDGEDADIVLEISYDHFGYPDADKLLFIAEEKDISLIDNFFVLNMSNDNIYYERSYAFYQNYYPKFFLNNVNFVLTNAVYTGPTTLGTIYGLLSSDELMPGIENLFKVDSYLQAPDGSYPKGNGVLSLIYQDNGVEIITTSNDSDNNIDLINNVGLQSLVDSIFPQPVGFSKTAPENSIDDEQLVTTDLSWEPSDGATSYEFCVDTTNDSACDTNWVNVEDSLGTTINLEFDTTYYWQVRSVNANGITYADGGEWWAFITETMPAPGEFEKISPVTSLSVSPTNVLLEWTDSYAATSYEYCLTDVIENEKPFCSEWVNVGSATSKTLNVEFGTTYYWQVKAMNEVVDDVDFHPAYANDDVWWSFTTTDTFSKISPEDGDTGLDLNVTLRWENLGSATYEYCFSETNSCTIWNPTTATSVSINKLKMNKTYYWQVKAFNSKGEEVLADGGIWSFTTKGPKGNNKP